MQAFGLIRSAVLALVLALSVAPNAWSLSLGGSSIGSGLLSGCAVGECITDAFNVDQPSRLEADAIFNGLKSAEFMSPQLAGEIERIKSARPELASLTAEQVLAAILQGQVQ